MKVVLGIGSNLEDRFAALQRAVDAVVATSGIRSVEVSPVYETDPVGGPDQPDYLNAVITFESVLEPPQILALAQGMEADAGRTRDVRWGARTLDVDVLAIDDLVSADETLTLPHPRAHERAFVLAPWRDLDPLGQIAGRGAVAELLATVDASGIRLRSELQLVVGE